MLLAVGSATDIKKLKAVSVKKRPAKEYLLYSSVAKHIIMKPTPESNDGKIICFMSAVTNRKNAPMKKYMQLLHSKPPMMSDKRKQAIEDKMSAWNWLSLRHEQMRIYSAEQISSVCRYQYVPTGAQQRWWTILEKESSTVLFDLSNSPAKPIPMR